MTDKLLNNRFCFAYNSENKILIDVSNITTIELCNGVIYINNGQPLCSDIMSILEFLEFYCAYHGLEGTAKDIIYKKLGVDSNGKR